MTLGLLRKRNRPSANSINLNGHSYKEKLDILMSNADVKAGNSDERTCSIRGGQLHYVRSVNYTRRAS